MNRPSLKISSQDVSNNKGSSPSDGTTSATRKSLHQNILGKLRPLPFQYHWAVWYDRHSDSATYDSRLYVLHEDVADIATFYRVYNNYPWDKVRLRDTVHIFRKGVKPVWEDPENLKGGCWTFRVPKAKSQAFFHEIAILCMANEFQAALESGTSRVIPHLTSGH
jgi:Eukaryotic initiation factor 4E